MPRTGLLHHRDAHDADRPRAGNPAHPPPVRETTAPYARHCRNGSKIAATSWSTFGSCRQILLIGSEMNSANAPGRLTPTPCVYAQRWRRPARQLRQRPQTTWPSPLTMPPGWKSFTLEPTSTISPTNSWPITSDTLMVFCAQSSQLSIWTSVTADTGMPHPDQYIIDANLGNRQIFQPKPTLRAAFHQSLHSLHCLWIKFIALAHRSHRAGCPIVDARFCAARWVFAPKRERLPVADGNPG